MLLNRGSVRLHNSPFGAFGSKICQSHKACNRFACPNLAPSVSSAKDLCEATEAATPPLLRGHILLS